MSRGPQVGNPKTRSLAQYPPKVVNSNKERINELKCLSARVECNREMKIQERISTLSPTSGEAQ